MESENNALKLIIKSVILLSNILITLSLTFQKLSVFQRR